jgi:hypothetical protein
MTALHPIVELPEDNIRRNFDMPGETFIFKEKL